MIDNSKIIIEIVDRRLKRAVGRSLSISLLFIFPISVGVLVDSSAMQWAGFIFGILLLFTLLFRQKNEGTFTSFDEAQAYLAKLKEGAA